MTCFISLPVDSDRWSFLKRDRRLIIKEKTATGENCVMIALEREEMVGEVIETIVDAHRRFQPKNRKKAKLGSKQESQRSQRSQFAERQQPFSPATDEERAEVADSRSSGDRSSAEQARGGPGGGSSRVAGRRLADECEGNSRARQAEGERALQEAPSSGAGRFSASALPSRTASEQQIDPQRPRETAPPSPDTSAREPGEEEVGCVLFNKLISSIWGQRNERPALQKGFSVEE